jgi:hypothetical protein
VLGDVHADFSVGTDKLWTGGNGMAGDSAFEGVSTDESILTSSCGVAITNGQMQTIGETKGLIANYKRRFDSLRSCGCGRLQATAEAV